MADKWETATLTELCEQIADCPHSTPLWTSSGVIVLRSQNIKGGRLDLSSPSYTDEAHFEQRSRRARLMHGDLVITREAPMGEVCMVPKGLRCCLGQRMVMLRPNPKRCNSRFLLYCIQSDAVQHEIQVNEGTGSTVSNRRIPLLKALPIPLPPLAEQKAIAAVLGALDDKIELNRRMNATLEAMARALFQSWFVDFDPVRAKLDVRPPAGLDPATAALFPSSFQDSRVGHIPTGWEVHPLGDAFAIKDGGTFQKEDRLETGSIVAFGANGPVGFCTRSNVNEPCIALGKIGSCGSVHRSWHPCWVTNNAFIVRPHHGGSLEFVWRTLCTIDFNQFIGGSANPYMPLKNFGHTPVVMPPKTLLSAYQERAGSLAAKIVANDNQSRTLATLRDTLLPKLLSGELSGNISI